MPCFSAEPLPRLTALASNVVSATCLALRKKGAYSGPLPSSTTTIWDGFAPLNSARRPQRISVGWYAGIRNTIGSSPVIGGLESMKSRFFLTHQGRHRGSKESTAGECHVRWRRAISKTPVREHNGRETGWSAGEFAHIFAVVRD